MRLDCTGAESFLPAGTVNDLAPAIATVVDELASGNCPGADYLGWLDLPAAQEARQFEALETAARRARNAAGCYVVIGIGGSYLGARAVLEALGADQEAPELLFAGTGLCSAALSRLLERVRGRDLRLCVISKSGTTLEPGVAFRVFRTLLEEQYGRAGAARRITAVTDSEKGALRRLAREEGYETFVIPDDVGGRFSVLTPVGLLPLAVAGIDIRGLVAGAADMRERCQTDELRANPAHLYAATRFALYKHGFHTEILSTFHSGLHYFQEWWKQLFGESEGKEGKGIFPASASFTTDLHSLGQYIQDGRRELLETFLCVRQAVSELTVPATPGGGDADGLDYLVGKSFDEINWQAYLGTRQAHTTGGVPCLAFELEKLETRDLGGLIYLFEKAVAVGGGLLAVNPFDQPGVEAYKQEMFRLLGKP
ncbi:MAG: glucose-6-phosphate isomerase [bacterium]